ncbi:MAG TPA: HhH-GPD-type base excision DNA repair protein [Gaiellaceae bacterium]
MPDALHFTGDAEADALIATDPLALVIGFALDQQVPVPTAFAGPLKLKQRLGTLDAGAIARTDPDRLEDVFRERPAIHRFPGNMAKRVRELCAVVDADYGGRADRIWTEAGDGDELRRRIEALPGFGEMKVKALGSVLAKRFGVAAAEPLVPSHPTLGDVDSAEALEEYQAQKRAYKAKVRQGEAPAWPSS